jgi:hypothetical protein
VLHEFLRQVFHVDGLVGPADGEAGGHVVRDVVAPVF